MALSARRWTKSCTFSMMSSRWFSCFFLVPRPLALIHHDDPSSLSSSSLASSHEDRDAAVLALQEEEEEFKERPAVEEKYSESLTRGRSSSC